MTASLLAIPDDLPDGDLRALLASPAAALRDGGLVAFPTETVYGLGADALSTRAVERIFLAKGRPSDNPLIVHLADASWMDRVAVVTPLARALAERFWPGPLTLVLDRRDRVPEATAAGLDSVAVRVPASRVARLLIDTAGTPVAAPSANRSGRPSPTTAAHVATDLGEDLDWIIDGGPCEIGIESTVVDARGDAPVVLREGSVTREMLGDRGAIGDPSRSPGTRHAHYQPRAAVRIAPVGRGQEVAADVASTGARVGLVTGDAIGVPSAVTLLAAPVDDDAMARELYAALRRADALGLDVVVVEAVTDTGVGRAVMDRLRRAGTPNDPAAAGSSRGASGPQAGGTPER